MNNLVGKWLRFESDGGEFTWILYCTEVNRGCPRGHLLETAAALSVGKITIVVDFTIIDPPENAAELIAAAGLTVTP